MRWPIMLLAAAAAAADAPPPGAPAGFPAAPAARAERSTAGILAEGGAAAGEVAAVLVGLGRGDPAPLRAAPPSLLSAAVGWPDPEHPGILRRWPALLAMAIARLPEDARRQAIACLPPPADLGEALDRLPSSAAAAQLRREADRAFDRGRFADFLDLAGRLGIADARVDAARDLAGWGGAGTLPAPDLPVPLAADAAGPAEVASAAGWRIAAGWLVRLDPAGRPAWQRRLAPGDRVAVGAGAALIAGDACSVLDPAGSERRLPPLPRGVAPLAVAGGAAWFAGPAAGPLAAWRVDLDDGAWMPVAMAEVPLAPPLVRGGDAWWLGRRMLHHTRAGRTIAVIEHGLAADGRWRWEADPRGARLRADDGRTWRVGAFPSAAALGGEAAWAERLIAAHRFAEAMEAAAAAERAGVPAGGIRLRAGIGLGLPAERLDGWAADAQDRALIALVRGDAAAAGAEDGAVLTAELEDRLWRPPAQWDHRAGAAAWRAGRARPPLPARGELADPPVASAPRPGPPAIALAIERGHDRVAVAGPGWRMAWDVGDFLAAPVIAAEVRGEAVVVAEGDGRVTILDRADGRRWFSCLPRSATVVGARAAALPGPRLLVQAAPLGVGTRIESIGDGGAEGSQALPRPAAWVAGVRDAALIAFRDGTAAWWPGLEPAALPAELAAAGDAVATAEGIVAAGRLWPWRR